jgi:uncharacterized protein YbaR (Trm112 family)
MFIELTDHLRCPAEHDEQFLVLLPEEMSGRMVRRGALGCPVCGRTYRVDAGVLTAAAAEPPVPPDGAPQLGADALAAFLGLGGPGGYLVLVGAPGALWQELLELIPGVAPVLVNPPADVPDEYPGSMIRSDRIPLKSRSMRGVVLGAEVAGDRWWRDEAARVVLPGLRVVGEGAAAAESERLELLASTAGAWVAAARAG